MPTNASTTSVLECLLLRSAASVVYYQMSYSTLNRIYEEQENFKNMLNVLNIFLYVYKNIFLYVYMFISFFFNLFSHSLSSLIL